MTNVDKESNGISNEIRQHYGDLIDASSHLNTEITSEIESWRVNTKRNFKANFPYFEDAHFFNSFNKANCTYTAFKKYLAKYKSLCKRTRSNFNNFWDKELAKITIQLKENKDNVKDLQSNFKLLSIEAKKLIEQLRVAWELEQIQLLRAELLKKLDEYLKKIKEITKAIKGLGIDPGVLMDLSEGALSINKIEIIKQWLDYLKKDTGVKSLLEMMGKLSQVKHSQKIEIVKQSITQYVPMPDINSKEEIVGIRLSKDIEHALPSELALMADPDTSLLFDLKYIESGLMCFDMEGIQHVEHEHEVEVEQTVDDEDKRGPLVICVDTSGSMQGAPETIAKAITMLMTIKAKQEKRACYLINFSTSIETLDLSNGFAIDNLITFLQKSFYGGTDVAPAIEEGIRVMQSEEYEKADMLIISDFVMSSLPETLLTKIEKLRESGNKFNSLVIDSCFMEHRLKTIFDYEWVYDPQNSSVIELLKFQEDII